MALPVLLHFACFAADGVILDNSRFSKPLYLEEKDREFLTPPTIEEKEKARMLWRAAVARRGLKVYVKNVYQFKSP